MTVEVSGPLFDGRAERALAQAEDAAAFRAGQYARDELRQVVRRDADRDTGYYESRLIVQRMANTSLVTDRGVVYGPWLEGATRRNNSTRFKGFAHFRRVAQAMNDDQTVVGILQEELDRRRGDLS